uniref:adenylate cyclase n=1 Tax=Albugo laibachii Nc14 TaxID=890382 RepID=F0X0G5_9STRA|nr:guanylate cyclase putative [Albugo laibachii Nc14]|eukprot:CCA27254.1 guanylate cyclase putative [Albugo laibachii Nc14]
MGGQGMDRGKHTAKVAPMSSGPSTEAVMSRKPRRVSSASDFAVFFQSMENVAIHYITLYFIDMRTSRVIPTMEKRFQKHFQSTQRVAYLRGLATVSVFMIVTTAYDYIVLWRDMLPNGSITAQKVSAMSEDSRLHNFVCVLLIKGVMVMPILLCTYIRVSRNPKRDDRRLTWLCATVVALYPLLYNKLTGDYGVSWVCLVIMYLYFCAPIRFFPCSIFCSSYLALYAIVMLTHVPEDLSSASEQGAGNWAKVSNDTMYAAFFFFIIILPSQQREFAIRLSYMSELMVLLQQEQLRVEETRSKSLLNSMLPELIVAQLQFGRELIADAYLKTSVLFCEVCEFDYISSKLKPQHVVVLLNIVFSKFDSLVDIHHVHKVETIGAVYMVVGGCPDPAPDHAHTIADLAIHMLRCMPEIRAHILKNSWGYLVEDLQIRIGINSGALMAGVVGIRNPRFKLFGDTVNVASRMETTNIPGQIQISEVTHRALSDEYAVLLRGKVPIKGRGEMSTFFLIGKAGEMIPNAITKSVIAAGLPIATPHPVSAADNRASRSRLKSLVEPLRPTQRVDEEIEYNEYEMGYTTSTLIESNRPKLQESSSNDKLLPRRTEQVAMRKKLLSQSTFRKIQDIVALGESHGSTSDVISSTQAAVARQAASLREVVASSIAATPFDEIREAEALIRTNSTRSLISPTLVVRRLGRSCEDASRNSITEGKPIVAHKGLVQRIMGASSVAIAPESNTSELNMMMKADIFDAIQDTGTFLIGEEKNKLSTSSEIMRLPHGLTRLEVFLRIHSMSLRRPPVTRTKKRRKDLTQEAFEFEEGYHIENRARWLRFLRISILVFILCKPLITFFQVLRLCRQRSFVQAQMVSAINLCILYPFCVAFLLFTFSARFREWEQLSVMVLLLVVLGMMNGESVLTHSQGYAYLSIIALYQCYFANLSFLLRVCTGCITLALYLFTFLVMVPNNDWLRSISSHSSPYTVGRNALYIFIFFVAQAWAVFNSEFKQRINYYREMTLNAQKQKLLEEKSRTKKLLSNLLPETIVEKLKENPEATIADFFDQTTVLFTDMVNFTAYSSKVSAMELVQFLNDMYTRFDTIAEKENLYKVEIIGDAYFVVGGCPVVSTNNALAVVTAATDMFATLPVLRRNCGNPDLNIRIGIHSGAVLAGVVGIKDPRYHIFGETVSIAHQLESSGMPGRIHISESTWAQMNKETPWHGYKVEYHSLFSMAGYTKKIRTYFVL